MIHPDLTLSTRFGQNTVQECEWCVSFTEYAVYTLAAIVLSYIKEAALLGLVTIRGTDRETWRSTTIGVLMLACIADVYWMLTVRIALDQQEVTMVGPIYRCSDSQCLTVIVQSGMTRSGLCAMGFSSSCPSSRTFFCPPRSPRRLSLLCPRRTLLSRLSLDGCTFSSSHQLSPYASQSSDRLLAITGRPRGWKEDGPARTRL